MQRFIRLFLVLILVFNLTGCTKTLSTTAMTEDQIKNFAEDFMIMMSDGEYEQAQNYFGSQLREALPVEKMESIWHGLIDQYGIYLKIKGTSIEAKQDYHIAYVTCLFQKQAIEAKIFINKKNEISGLFFVPSSHLPDVPAGSFKEQDVLIENGDFQLSGIMTLPTEGEQYPGIVLVHNSITKDRDGTLGPNKILRDLAWELAAEGIATLRYDKRAHAYPEYFVNNYEYTPEEDIISDAVAALGFMREHDKIDDQNIFVLGHGIGGTVAPRIATGFQEQISGIILLAALARPVEEAVAEQYEYFYALDTDKSDEEVSLLNSVHADIQILEAIYRGEKPKTKRIVLGLPVSYWLDLHEYDPGEYAHDELNLPFLVLQGGRDYQVTREDYEIWRRSLEDKNAVFHYYDDLNHMFMPGEGKILPAEYLTPNNVSQFAVDDISRWVKQIFAKGAK